MNLNNCILSFILQSEDYPQTAVNKRLHNSYRDYIPLSIKSCNTVVGLSSYGDTRYDITYIAFVGYGQTVKCGVYPVILYYRKIKKVVLAYGISATNAPANYWDWKKLNIEEPTQIADLFSANGWSADKKYHDSFVFSWYDVSSFVNDFKYKDILNGSFDAELSAYSYLTFEKDLDTLIDNYHKLFDMSNDDTYATNDEHFGTSTKDNIILNVANSSLQQIFYGAPGTGKSHGISAQTKGKNVIRTTFHPDSDYSTFVGAYKPIKESAEKESLLSAHKLHEMYPTFQEGAGSHAISKFVAKHYNSFLAMTKEEAKSVFSGYCSDSTLEAILPNALVAAEAFAEAMPKNGQITYTFVPQAFIQAYVAAWRDVSKPVFLVIEEINRGNCAQIFGDIFQLLDRKDNGYSSYWVNPDQDIKNYLAEEFAKNGIDDCAF